MKEMEVALQKGSSCLVSVRGLRRDFGDLRAVKGVDLDIMSGEIFGLVGPDGAGKTTILRLLCGLMRPSGGTAEVGGIDIHQNPDRVRDSIGYMPQKFGLYSDLTVAENLDFYADLFGLSKEDRRPLIQRFLKMTRMELFTDRFAGQLSGGMKQKLALSCTLLHRPRVLLLDEPTNGVDPISRRDFWAILYQLVRDGVTVLISTSYLDEAERCSRVALLDKGLLIDCDTPEALRSQFAGRVFACRCSDRAAARRALMTLPAIVSAEPAGALVHVCLVKGVDVERDLKPYLPSEVEEFELIPPSLEDIFIAMVREEELDG